VLTKLGGKSVAEAAAIAGTTPGALKLRAHRAYGKLRVLLASEDAPAGAPLAATA
jgi:DNA-directed RNA polymerase specialized sigma24 family protein